MLRLVRTPVVTKEYVEDQLEDFDETCRYWQYIFDFGERRPHTVWAASWFRPPASSSRSSTRR